MPVIAVEDIAYVRFEAPDLELMERFLIDFGLVRAARTADTLYMRGKGSAPYVHITHQGPTARGIGLGLRAQSSADLQRLADHLGTGVEDSPEPAGGQVVRCTDPAGFRVEVLCGQTLAEPLAVRPSHQLNAADVRRRPQGAVRTAGGPSQVMRLGHAVLFVPDFEPVFDFYHQVLGLRISDSLHMQDPEKTTFAFLHCGLGARYTDHHTLALGTPPGGIESARFDHVAYEVLDLEDLQAGHAHLKAGGWRHSWGVGRHVLGSQLFDYWRDPFGHKVEHWTDGDLVNDQHQPSHGPLQLEGLSQWAPPLTPEFFE
ncbi:VOC family protein [Polaromonas glacialis]|uniref:VOC family protein n=1 Tax=Polaromonas glacialis TaxID=866564 RepID=UPI0004970901|nr:VOC family protein [Polaromonas glacialis]